MTNPPFSQSGRCALPLIACALGLVFLAAPARRAAAQDGISSASAGFEPIADKALAAMRKRAEELNIKGVAVVSYSPGKEVMSWSSKMAVVGRLTDGTTETRPGNNLLAIAYSKAAEMASTQRDSGSGVRKPMTGEFGWQGGVTAAGRTGRLICAFSGGKSEDDVKVSQAGLEILASGL